MVARSHTSWFRMGGCSPLGESYPRFGDTPAARNVGKFWIMAAHYFTWYMGMSPHHVQSLAFINLFHGFSSSHLANWTELTKPYRHIYIYYVIIYRHMQYLYIYIHI